MQQQNKMILIGFDTIEINLVVVKDSLINVFKIAVRKF